MQLMNGVRFISLAFIVLACFAPLPAQDLVVVIPMAAQDADTVTGLAFANPSSEFASVQLQYLDAEGLFQTDPVDLDIGPNSQIARNMVELFGDAAQGSSGWVLALTDNINVVGFFLIFSPDVSRIDGAEGLIFEQRADDLVFPDVTNGIGFPTRFNVVGFGPDGQPLTVDLSLVAESGAVLQTKQQILPAFPALGSLFSSEVGSFFDVPIPELAYVRVNSPGNALFGFESFGNDDFTASRNAIPVSTQGIDSSGTLFGAQLVSDSGGLSSDIVLINPTGTATTIDFRATPTGPPDAMNPPVSAQRNLPAGAMLMEAADDLFGLNGAFVGWLEVTSNDVTGLVGDVIFGSDDVSSVSSVQLQSIPSTDFVYSQVSQGATNFTGITFLNANDQSAQVGIEVYDAFGFMTGQEDITLEGNEHRPRVLGELIPGFPDQAGGFIRVVSDVPLFSFELFGFTNDGLVTSLSAVPPQRISGRISGRITITVAPGPPAQQQDVGPIFVSAVDPASQVTQQTEVTTAAEDYAFRFLTLSGQYQIVAGTDMDEDGIICEPDTPDDLCGAFSDEGGPATVTVLPGQESADVDFELIVPGVPPLLLKQGLTKGVRVKPSVRFRRPDRR